MGFLDNNLNLVESSEDREVLRRIAEVKLSDENAPIERFSPQLGEEGRNILDLLSHVDPAQAVPEPRKVYCQILKTYAHVDPEQKPSTAKTLFSFYLPEGWNNFRLVYKLMGYR